MNILAKNFIKLCFFLSKQGGDGFQNVVTNNPLYITDHRDGGFGLKTDYEKERETIWAGVEHGQIPTGVGPVCEYQSIEGADKADQSSTFEVRQLFKRGS